MLTSRHENIMPPLDEDGKRSPDALPMERWTLVLCVCEGCGRNFTYKVRGNWSDAELRGSKAIYKNWQP